MKIRAALVLLILTVTSALWAGGSAVQIRVKGMSCPFCARGIEKHLKKVEGVTGVTSDFKQSLFTVQFKEDGLLDLKALKQAVKDAGFSVDSIKTEAGPQ